MVLHRLGFRAAYKSLVRRGGVIRKLTLNNVVSVNVVVFFVYAWYRFFVHIYVHVGMMLPCISLRVLSKPVGLSDSGLARWRLAAGGESSMSPVGFGVDPRIRMLARACH